MKDGFHVNPGTDDRVVCECVWYSVWTLDLCVMPDMPSNIYVMPSVRNGLVCKLGRRFAK